MRRRSAAPARPSYGPSKPADPLEAATRCRCRDPEGKMWVYLNSRCAFRDEHRQWETYGFTQNSISVTTAEYHRAWLNGDFNDTLPPEGRPGYRHPVTSQVRTGPEPEPAPAAARRAPTKRASRARPTTRKPQPVPIAEEALWT